MKKKLIVAALGLFAINAFADVKIELKGFTNDSVSVSTLEVTGKRMAPDTVLVAKKGKIVLPDVQSNTRFRILPHEWDLKKSPYATIYVAPGEKFTVTFTKGGDDQEYKVNGSALQAQVDAFDAKLISLAKKINGMEKGAERDSLISEYYAIPKSYVEANPDSPIAFYALARTSDEDYAEKMMPKLGQGARSSMFVAYEEVLNNAIKAKHEIDAAKKLTAEGEMAPDFELPTPDGSMLKMTSLRGKWVLVDFWGSWCIWCIRGIPQLKANYEKYKDKMEVLSIACRDKKDKWLAAIEKHQLNWKHVISENVVPGTDKRVEQMFGVEGYPTKLLVNPEGKIVKRCVGEDPKFYDDFEELMK